MAPLERLRNESLNKKEQAAFSELADTLIFETPPHFKLSRKTVPELSMRIQESFRAHDHLHEREQQAFFENLITKAIAEAQEALHKGMPRTEKPEKEIKEEKPKEVTAEIDNRSDKEKILTAARLYISSHGREYWQSQGYSAWGFTPRIAGMRTKEYERPFEKDGKNCFGVVQGLGALFNDMGLQFEMGITADHPFVLVNLEGKTYLASLYGMHEAKGTFETHDGCKMYTPSPEDNIPYKLMTVWDFDEALVYELLENFEVLRQMSLGNKVQNLPGSEESGMKLAEQHRGAIQGTSWRTIQEKVTPRLAAYFHAHDTEWAAELERVGIARQINHFFGEVMDAGKSATSMKDLSFEEFKKVFLPAAKAHGQAIADYIVAGTELSPDTPDDVLFFARRAKEVLGAITIPELQAEVTRGFLKPFIAKTEKAEVLTEK